MCNICKEITNNFNYGMEALPLLSSSDASPATAATAHCAQSVCAALYMYNCALSNCPLYNVKAVIKGDLSVKLPPEWSKNNFCAHFGAKNV